MPFLKGFRVGEGSDEYGDENRSGGEEEHRGGGYELADWRGRIGRGARTRSWRAILSQCSLPDDTANLVGRFSRRFARFEEHSVRRKDFRSWPYSLGHGVMLGVDAG